MDRRHVLLAFVGLLVVTAGCVGNLDLPGVGDADGSDESPDESSDGPSDGSSADDGASDGSGDGNDDGSNDGNDGSSVGNANDQSAGDGVFLVENRTAALREAGSYAWTWEMQSREDGEVVGGTTYTAAVDAVAERTTFGMQMTSGGVVTTELERFYADGTNYERYGSDGQRTYQVGAAEFTTQVSVVDANTYVTRASQLDDFDRVGTETYDGVTVTRYERTDRPTYLGGQIGSEDDFRWTDFSYEVLIDEDGLVRYESWTTEGVDGDDVPVSITFSYSLTGVGSTTVDEPAWVATAREESTA